MYGLKWDEGVKRRSFAENFGQLQLLVEQSMEMSKYQFRHAKSNFLWHISILNCLFYEICLNHRANKGTLALFMCLPKFHLCIFFPPMFVFIVWPTATKSHGKLFFEKIKKLQIMQLPHWMVSRIIHLHWGSWKGENKMDKSENKTSLMKWDEVNIKNPVAEISLVYSKSIVSITYLNLLTVFLPPLGKNSAVSAFNPFCTFPDTTGGFVFGKPGCPPDLTFNLTPLQKKNQKTFKEFKGQLLRS